MIELSYLKKTIVLAGQTIVAMSQQPPAVIAHKPDHSPVTMADLTANQILQDQLLGAFPEDGWLSEETQDDKTRFSKKRIWIVDPLDGTKEYIQHRPEYVVSVALVEEGQSILAAIFNPVTQELFYAVRGQGAWLNDQPITCDETLHDTIRVLASRSEVQRGEWQRFENRFTICATGSIAYKLALLAAGRTQAVFSLSPRSEWDIAAGVLLVTEAGGLVHDLTDKTFVFNQQNIRVNGIMASANCVYHEVMQAITAIEGYK